ncbi:MAG: methyltransferase family protein [Bacteroidota bacterium]|jgi:protein-S-isoprenylcysteine O-methyltransferase Ste14|nr:isoprenylcysteine carboxylmethyltransferase family protein [Ignavibacteria bacterium]MCU7498612.1 isoprenylcysteine carboxylmethyltransferase family protein [Ignavibacteria bacterium]MCU7512484.1 isoprenylcysteine carboxylmethyltransferase family protein [Ignavibacteria bacterium]MCU7520919.1 isoprenylcysteine carboxylmethyltransferase family protein [Ignavibacteria bacterium]MCU7523597.1 isoprenylcysteine carboxylmethyltransferase family protein [Ignavibacteria bacterium]
MSSIQAKIFKYRSYTPIPFLVLMLLFRSPNIYSIIIGFIVAASGELIRLWGVSYAGSETRTTGAVGGTYLVISGPFAHTRNPLYVGNILLYMGIGIMSLALFPYLQIAAFVFFYLQYKFIINEEETYLKKAFGAQYEEYYKNVPRFLPRISAYKNNNVTQPKYNIAAGLKSERRTLQAFSIVSLTIIIIWFVSRY